MEALRIQTAIEKKTIPELIYLDSEGNEPSSLSELFAEELGFADLYPIARESFPDVEPLDVAKHYLMLKRKTFSRVKEVYENQLQEAQNEVASAIAGDVGKRTDYVAETMLADDQIGEYETSYEKRVREFTEGRKEVGSVRKAMDLIPVPESTEPVVRRLFVTYESGDSTDALELFNRAEVSPRLPFLAAPPFYKIECNAPFSPQTIPETGGRVMGYVKQESGMYAMVALGPNEVVVESPDHNASLESARAPQEEILSAVRMAFGMALTDPRQVKEELRIEYFFPGMDVHPILFKHFLFTDPVVRTFFFLDERVMVSRKKTYVYLHYYPTPDSDPINLMVSNGECGVRVYMSRCARPAVRDAMADVGRCLLSFRDKRAAIERELLPSAGVAGIISKKELDEEYDKQKKECVRKELTAREVWKGSASTRSVGFPPRLLRTADPATHRLLNPEDSPDPDRWANQTGDREVLLFPKKGDTRFEQYYYTCPPEIQEHADRTHIGLQQVGDTQFPNCYKVNQESVAAYRSGEEAKSSKVDYILTTGKVLRVKGQIGSMLPDLDRWMALTDPDRILYRYAYADPTVDPASILGLLNHALSIKEDMQASRNRLAGAVSGDLLTEAVPYNVDQLRRMATDPDGWIDPRIYYHALRRAYETEIVLFTKDENRSKSPFRIACPYYHYVYDEIPTRRYDRAVMVCVNTGGDRDTLPHPVCELVIAVPFDTKPPSAKQMGGQRPDLPTTDPLYERLDEMVREWYGRTVRSHPFGAPTAQTLDTFGKVLWLHFGDVSIHLTIPIHSINVPVRRSETFGCSPAEANAWLAGRVVEAEERRAGAVRLGLVGAVEGHSFFLPFRREEKLMDTYKKYEKVSRIMLEYVFYLFSRYLSAGRDTKYGTFVEFSREQFEIDPAVTYDVLPRKFSMDNSYLRGGKLRVANELVRSKLMYSLRQECGLNPEAVREYHKREDMMNYYVYLSDFEERPNAIVLEGEASMRKYYEKRGDRGLPEGKKEIQIEADEPYILYFSVPEVGVSRWLVQPVDSAERGVAVCEEWRRSGVNRPDKEPARGEYTLIQWESETSYHLSGSGDRYVSWIHTPRGNVYQAMLPYM
jgi:hypothetical protein